MSFTSDERAAIAAEVVRQNEGVLVSATQVRVDEDGNITVNQRRDGTGWHLCSPIFKADRFPGGIRLRSLIEVPVPHTHP